MTGCRKREALDLLWKDVDFERSTVFFRKTKTDPRKQQMSEALRSFLLTLPSQTYSPYVFPGRTPERPLENVRKPWDKIRQSLGLDRLRVHDIRHTVLSDIAAESDLQTAAMVGGHKSIRSTIRYVHGRTEEASRALDATRRTHKQAFLAEQPQETERGRINDFTHQTPTAPNLHEWQALDRWRGGSNARQGRRTEVQACQQTTSDHDSRRTHERGRRRCLPWQVCKHTAELAIHGPTSVVPQGTRSHLLSHVRPR